MKSSLIWQHRRHIHHTVKIQAVNRQKKKKQTTKNTETP